VLQWSVRRSRCKTQLGKHKPNLGTNMNMAYRRQCILQRSLRVFRSECLPLSNLLTPRALRRRLDRTCLSRLVTVTIDDFTHNTLLEGGDRKLRPKVIHLENSGNNTLIISEQSCQMSNLNGTGTLTRTSSRRLTRKARTISRLCWQRGLGTLSDRTRRRNSHLLPKLGSTLEIVNGHVTAEFRCPARHPEVARRSLPSPNFKSACNCGQKNFRASCGFRQAYVPKR
jgi:hypothetical protein